MIVEQTVEIPASHRLVIDVPREVPAGKVILTFTPAEADARKSDTPISDRLAGCLEDAGDINLEAIREERLVKYL